MRKKIIVALVLLVIAVAVLVLNSGSITGKFIQNSRNKPEEVIEITKKLIVPDAKDDEKLKCKQSWLDPKKNEIDRKIYMENNWDFKEKHYRIICPLGPMNITPGSVTETSFNITKKVK